MIWVPVILLAVVALLGITYYNSFVARRNQADQAFATIDVLLKKRADLVPNLVATVRQYMQHEQQTLERITQLRSRMADDTSDTGLRLSADNELNRLVGGILVQVERYPELKADQSFHTLQDSLHVMEEQLSAARRAFNANVTSYNTGIQLFPANLVAGMFGFRARSLLEIPPESKRTPDVAGLFKR